MKVAFVYRGAENLGIEYLSSYLKARGHEVALFLDPASFGAERGSHIPLLDRLTPDYVPKIVAKLEDWKPDMVGFSVYTAGYRWALDVARAIKKSVKAPIVFGGVHVTADPARVLKRPEVDAVVVGEGEGAIVDLVESIENGRITRTDIPNVGVRVDSGLVINRPRPYIRNLDTIPLPDKLLFYEKSPAFAEAYLAMTSRGCPFRCHYCMNSLYPSLYDAEGGHIRRQSVERVVSEIVPWKGLSRMVTFWDDVFPMASKWLGEFAESYSSRIGLPFLIYVHPRSLTPEAASLLKKAGCAGVKIGVQSVSEQGREFLGRPGTPDEARRAAKMLRDVGIPFSMDHILGLPGESARDFIDAVEFYNETRPIRVNSHWLSYFPGAKLLDEAVEQGRVSQAEAEDVREGVGQRTFMHPGDDSRPEIRDAATAMMIFDLVPLLPEGWIRRLIRNGLPRRLRYNRVAHQALVVLASLKARDSEIRGYLRYAFGRKNVP